MIRRWLVLPLLAVALAACGRGGAAAVETSLGAPVQLAPGQSVVIKNEKLEVRFAGIASDSRCPGDVTCLWAGEIVVQLAVRNDNRTTQHELREMESATIAGYSVAILQVLPARTSSQPIAPGDYRVTLKITR